MIRKLHLKLKNEMRHSVSSNPNYNYNCPPEEDRYWIISPSGKKIQVAIEMEFSVDTGNDSPSYNINDSRHVVELPGQNPSTYYRTISGIDYSKYGWTHIVMSTFWRNTDGYWVPSNNTERIQELKNYDNMSFGERMCILL